MKVLKKFFAGLAILLIFCGSVSAADVSLPPAVKEAIGSRVLIKIFPQTSPFLEIYGSGFVVDSKGHIATCYHLIYGFLGSFSKSDLVIEVRKSAEEQPVLAEIIFEEYKNDFLILKMKNPKDAAKLGPPAKIADSFPPDGTTVYLSGFTFSGNFSATFKADTVGRVKNFSYNGFVVDEVVIVDRQIIPGFSGGPVFNKEGEVVGMNLATGSGISAILPVEPIKEMLKKIK